MTGQPTHPGSNADQADIPPGIELAPGVFIPESAVTIQFSRASGPGGQNVNKVNTKAEFWLDFRQVRGMSPGAVERLVALAGRRMSDDRVLHLVGQSHRGQTANRQEVMDRLREMIVQALVEPKRRRRRKPSAAARQRRLESKRRRSDVKANRRGNAGEM